MEKPWDFTVCPREKIPLVECSFCLKSRGLWYQHLSRTLGNILHSCHVDHLSQNQLWSVCFRGQLLIFKVLQTHFLHKPKSAKIIRKILPETFVKQYFPKLWTSVLQCAHLNFFVKIQLNITCETLYFDGWSTDTQSRRKSKGLRYVSMG